ncbi:MAG: glycosyltransferase [Solirubrobacteraceae bacterium]
MTSTHELLAPAGRLQLLKFCLVGAAGYVLNTGAFALSVALGSQNLPAATVAFAIAVAANFWCNRRWTFHVRDHAPGGQAARFFAVSVAAFLFGAAVLELLVELVQVPALPAQAASIIVAMPLNFLGNKTWSFDDRRPATEPVVAAGGAAAPNTWLVLPTYNEAENLEPFVLSVLPQLAAAAREHHVLIVDDASPDGTGDIADRLAADLEPVHVLHRPQKDGLGRAYVAGFQRALAAGAELVVQMDADFSHAPESVPALIAAARDADVVLGSRYVAGGCVADWGLARRLLSRGGSWYARTVLGVGVRDLTGGFKCFRRHVLEGLGLPGLQSAGFGFQIEVTYRALQAGARVREIPIRFRDRQAGVSKMSARIVAEALWQVLALRRSGGRRQRLAMPRSAATMPTATITSAASAIAQRSVSRPSAWAASGAGT